MRERPVTTVSIGAGRFTKCMPCRLIPPKYGNSTPNDLVISGAFGQVRNALKFLRSLRTVGCMASVVFVTNGNVPESTLQEFRDCGAQFFTITHLSRRLRKFSPHCLRFFGYKDYLDHAGKQFDRILHSDSFDVFFQSDPFTDNIRNDRLYFTMEDRKIKNCPFNSRWIRQSYNESVLRALGNFTISCSGTIIGGYDQFMRYLVTMITHEPFLANGGTRLDPDQAYHNYLLHTGAFERAGVRAEYMGCNSPVLSMHYCSRHHNRIYQNRVRGPDGTTVPALVHQYNRYRDAITLVDRLCSE